MTDLIDDLRAELETETQRADGLAAELKRETQYHELAVADAKSNAEKAQRLLAERDALAAELDSEFLRAAEYKAERDALQIAVERLRYEVERLRAVLDSKECQYRRAVDEWHNRAIAAEQDNATLRALLPDPALLRRAAGHIAWLLTIVPESLFDAERSTAVADLRAAAERLEATHE